MTVARRVRLAVAGLIVCSAGTRAQTPADSARSILRRTGFRGGVIVHVGCADGRLTAALGEGRARLVHGLDLAPEAVARARDHIRSRGLYGIVTADRWRGPTLPYVDNLAALVVVNHTQDLPREEILRILRPGGIAVFPSSAAAAAERILTKPWPVDIDDWTHFLHGPGGNAVAEDSRVGAPRHMQWLADPAWTRNHHKLASISSVVSAGGRLFYIVDHATAAAMRVPGRWTVTARDAFSGMRLWERPLQDWAWHGQKFRSGPVQLPRLLVATPDTVYVPLGLGAPVAALDAASGESLQTYPETRGTEEMLLTEDTLLTVVGAPAPEHAVVGPQRGRGAVFPNRKAVVALRASTGAVLWRWPANPEESADIMPLTLAADESNAVLQAGKTLVCLDLTNGSLRWRCEPDAPVHAPNRRAGWSVATVVLEESTVFWADGRTLRAVDAANGQQRWQCPCTPTFHSPVDVFVVDGLVWVGPEFREGRDPLTGEVRRENSVAANLWTAGHHHRCYRNKATRRFILTAKRGVELIDLLGDSHSRNNWVRGVCQYGVLPCNGLLYAPPHTCGCYIEAKLFGFWALAPAPLDRPDTGPATATATPIEQGPDYHTPMAASEGGRPSWLTYRGDPQRSAATKASVPAELQESWSVQVGSNVSAPVTDGRVVLLSDADACTVIALDAATGERLWEVVAGGRVDSPPTIYRGRALFGCGDGYLYALTLESGRLAWRRRIAPENRRTVVRERLESVWPLSGSVLVLNDLAYAVAGRSSYLDGGIALEAVDPRTGQCRHKALLRTPHPTYGDEETRRLWASMEIRRIDQNAVDGQTLEAPDQSDAFGMAGARRDLLVSDGRRIFLRHRAFSTQLVELPGRFQHLFSTTTLLDSSEIHRTHMVLGVGNFLRLPVAYSWIANSFRGRRGAGLATPYGLLLAVEGNTVWGVRRHRGYALFSRTAAPDPDAAEAGLDFVRRGRNTHVDPGWTWSTKLDLRPRALVKADEHLLVAGTPLLGDSDAARDEFVGRGRGLFRVFSAADGSPRARLELRAAPVWNGVAVTDGRVFVSTVGGRVICLEAQP